MAKKKKGSAKKKAGAASSSSAADTTGSWTLNNVAARRVFSTLVVLEQVDRMAKFSPTGPLAVSSMSYWAAGASGAAREGRAEALARQLDNVFTMLQGARYQASSGTKKQKRKNSIGAMSKTLKDKNKTIAELASAADGSYLFLGEMEVV